MFMRLMGKCLLVAAALAVYFAADHAAAATREEMEQSVIRWVGEGPNTAFVVVDFDDASTLSLEFAFAVRFTSATITGREALDLVQAETDLSYALNGWGMMSDIWWQHKGRPFHGSGEFPPWWSYWNSSDYGTSWTFASEGFDTRQLGDGDVDGWLNTRDTGWPVRFSPNGPRMSARAALEEDVYHWVGSGPNTAYIAVDFSDSTTSSAEFVFGVRFTSSTITGREAMDLIQAGTNLDYALNGWGMMSEINFTDAGTTYSGTGEFPPWWSYWTSSDYGTSWTFASEGFDTRQLGDGDMDGWLNTMDTGWPVRYSPNGPRVTPRSMLERSVVAWAGSGPHKAYVVVDFDDSTTKPAEFAFGVRFSSPTLTGHQAMDLLTSSTSLRYELNAWGMMSEMWYNNAGNEFHGTGEFPPWWSYWTSPNFGGAWEFVTEGFDTRVMEDGDTDGWRNTMDTISWPPLPPNGPRTGRPALAFAALIDFFLGRRELTREQLPEADANGDGRIDMGDAIRLRQN
jgi:hypothetical protein